jgi:hypothetical protein
MTARRAKTHLRLIDDDHVIVIGRSELSGRIARLAGSAPVVSFASLDELDQWRAEVARGGDATIQCDLVGALEDIGKPLESLPRKLRIALEAIASDPHVPALARIEAQWSSRRSFYRVWNDSIPETPSTFLRRVRTRHAKRLIALGRAKKEAAFLAGFSSVDQMRKYLKT